MPRARTLLDRWIQNQDEILLSNPDKMENTALLLNGTQGLPLIY